jgi:hypothetical protein
MVRSHASLDFSAFSAPLWLSALNLFVGSATAFHLVPMTMHHCKGKAAGSGVKQEPQIKAPFTGPAKWVGQIVTDISGDHH